MTSGSGHGLKTLLLWLLGLSGDAGGGEEGVFMLGGDDFTNTANPCTVDLGSDKAATKRVVTTVVFSIIFIVILVCAIFRSLVTESMVVVVVAFRGSRFKVWNLEEEYEPLITPQRAQVQLTQNNYDAVGHMTMTAWEWWGVLTLVGSHFSEFKMKMGRYKIPNRRPSLNSCCKERAGTDRVLLWSSSEIDLQRY